MADLEAKNKTIPTLEEYLQGRRITSVYMIVYDHFIPCVSTSKAYKESIRERLVEVEDNSELFTMSDEAFTLLILENYYDRWMDIYHSTGGVPRRRLGSRKKKEPDSEVKPKYTAGGIVYKNSTDTKGKGWQDDGILRYNELFEWVEQDRANNDLFMTRYLELKRKNENDFIHRKKTGTGRTRVIPRCDLGLNLGMSKLVVTPPTEKVDNEVLPNGAASDTDESEVEGGFGTDDDNEMQIEM